MKTAFVAVVLACLVVGCAPKGSVYSDQYMSLRYPKTWLARPSTEGPGVRLAPTDWKTPGPPPITVIVVPLENGATMESLVAAGKEQFLSNAVGSPTSVQIRVGGKAVECMSFTQSWRGEKQPLRVAQIPGRTCLYTIMVRDGSTASSADVSSILDSLEMLQ